MNGRRVMYLGTGVALLILVSWVAFGWPIAAIGFGQGFCVGAVVVALAVLVDPRWRRR